MLTIRNPSLPDPDEAAALALGALGFILSDDRRAQRFLDLTGLDADGLRAALGEEATHRAIIEFLCAHEPDLVGAAESLGISPETLRNAGQPDFLA
ncbi:DUF3572 family protein [Alteraurantiacibacter palmitatis]|uniref:DUF3572 family protein n=1 Tax=Alteraurantiacibacter palmitatis TaxID=2054628 RepID=A0ABV7E6A9_9SPHN